MSNSDFFDVKTKSGKNVQARNLYDSLGNIVSLPNGQPMPAPAIGFSLRSFAEETIKSGMSILDFRTNGPLDLQRNYNGLTSQGGDGFVEAFTPLASFAFGYVGARFGYKLDTLKFGGGVLNFKNSLTNKNINSDGEYYNNIANVPNIENGYDQFMSENPYGKTAFPEYFPNRGFSTEFPGQTGYLGPYSGFDTPSERPFTPDMLHPGSFNPGQGLSPNDNNNPYGGHSIGDHTSASDAHDSDHGSQGNGGVSSSGGGGSGTRSDPWGGLRDGPSNDTGHPNSPSSHTGHPNSPSSHTGHPNSPSSHTSHPSNPTHTPTPTARPDRPTTPSGRPDEGSNSGPGNPRSNPGGRSPSPLDDYNRPHTDNPNGPQNHTDYVSDLGSAIGGFVGRVTSFFSPVLLDLENNGFDLNTLDNSSFFADLNGDGQQTRMAWAGAGTGVLVIDADGDGKISQEKEFAFTKWDANAQTDLEAVKSVFDTNDNGKLDAGHRNVIFNSIA